MFSLQINQQKQRMQIFYTHTMLKKITYFRCRAIVAVSLGCLNLSLFPIPRNSGGNQTFSHSLEEDEAILVVELLQWWERQLTSPRNGISFVFNTLVPLDGQNSWSFNNAVLTLAKCKLKLQQILSFFYKKTIRKMSNQ